MPGMVCLSQQAQSNGSWNAPYAINNGAAMDSVLAANQNADGTLEVFWCDTSNKIQHSWQTAPGATTWTPAIPFSNDLQASQMVLTCNKEQQLTLVWVDPGNHVQVARQNSANDHTHWTFEGFNPPGVQVTACANANKLLEIFYIGTDTFFYRVTQNPDLTWPSQAIKTPWAGKDITLAQNGDGRLEMFCVGTNDLIYHAWQPSANSDNWQESQLSGGARKIVAGNNSDHTITIFYIGLDGYVYHNTQVPNVGRWGGDIRAFQGPYYQGQAVAIGTSRNADGRLQLIYQGTDGYSYSSWQQSQNGGYVGGVRNAPGTAFCAITGADGRISQFYIGQPTSVSASFIQDGNQICISYSGLNPGSVINISWVITLNESGPGGPVLTTVGSAAVTVVSWGYEASFPIPNALLPSSGPGDNIQIVAKEQNWILIPCTYFPGDTPCPGS